MVTKTIIALGTALILSTAIASVASAQDCPRKQSVQPYSNFEKLWFSMPVGEDN